MLRCGACFILSIPDNKEDKCPKCGGKAEKQCKADHPCRCSYPVQAGKKYCPECGKFICLCGAHDVVVVSRITGYLSDVSGWNAGKRQELEDRNRVNIDPLAKEF